MHHIGIWNMSAYTNFIMGIHDNFTLDIGTYIIYRDSR